MSTILWDLAAGIEHQDFFNKIFLSCSCNITIHLFPHIHGLYCMLHFIVSIVCMYFYVVCM